ncbi:hypothetical protein pdam_00008676 [Pocillopora damicornis]|uniref:ubiquitinyl hydrolase 1 n=1 Tax=Pocillopora damicornis TaxID=46731 RepID=A0A3M6TG11_POCDA|nr:hypothetical protein pdam_00008676 [Pocillopora damicornis]
MGATASQLEKDIGHEFPQNEHYFGLVNFGNTCYCNSVLQALFFCRPFRERVLGYKPLSKRKESLLTCLADLFGNIASQKKKVGVLAPKKFVARLRKENELFDNYMQQDAHEFLNYLLNTIADLLQGEKAKEKDKDKHSSTSSVSSKSSVSSAGTTNGGSQQNNKTEPTWVHDIFEGILTNETRCLCCETEAQKRMRVKKLPKILALHLKRFKYMEQLQRYAKLSYRVVFPFELRLFNTSDDAINHEKLYDLVAVVIHCGSGPNRGHYITIVKSHGLWLLFDDDIVEKIEAQAIEEFYGLTSEIQKSSESGYILFYEARG